MKHSRMENAEILELERLIAAFEAQHPELSEAMRVFGISSAEYGRAMRALTFTPTHSATSTQPTAIE
jgi:hypothetical protein